jgi:hypothetical protein
MAEQLRSGNGGAGHWQRRSGPEQACTRAAIFPKENQATRMTRAIEAKEGCRTGGLFYAWSGMAGMLGIHNKIYIMLCFGREMLIFNMCKLLKVSILK